MRHVMSLVTACLAIIAANASAQSDTTFTYQGELRQNGSPADGEFTMAFSLWDAAVNGSQIGSTQTINDVSVTNGRFDVALDFGAEVFSNTSRWLEITVNGVTLSPRQPVSRAPYSIQTRGLFVDDQNQVGIGTASPNQQLEIVNPQAAVRLRSFTGNTGSTLELMAPGGIANTLGSIAFLDTVATEVGSIGMRTSIVGDRLFLQTADTDALVIDQNQNVGIGITSPQWPLHVETNNFSANAIVGRATSTNVTESNVGVFGESLGGNGSGVFGLASNIDGVNEGVLGQSDGRGGKGVFGVATSTSTDGTSHGVWGAAASPTGRGVFGWAQSNFGACIGVQGKCDSPAGYDFFADGAGINYGSSSSIRWKQNIQPIHDPLFKVAQLRGVSFDWDAEHGGHRDIGMIAEEVGAVLPEVVQYEENGVDAVGMDYSKLTPVLIEAMNALRAEKDAEIDQQRDEIAQQRDEIAKLRNRIERLEAMLHQIAADQQPVQ